MEYLFTVYPIRKNCPDRGLIEYVGSGGFLLLEGLVACLCIGLLITCWYVWVGRIYQEYRHYTILRTALIKAHNVVTQVCAEHDYSIDTTDDVRVQVMKKYCGDIPVIEVNASWTNAPHKKGSITLYGIQDLRMSHNTAL